MCNPFRLLVCWLLTFAIMCGHSQAQVPDKDKTTTLKKLLRDADFGTVDVRTVVQTIAFPSVLDYVRFQVLATPMTVLLKDKIEPERQAIISLVASRAATLSTSDMLDGGKFTFPQEAYVAVACPSDNVG